MKMIKNHSELWMVLFTVSILLILFTPISANLLDCLLIINASWALMILVLTFYIDKPLSFSTFPSLLLISTLFRLSLNISATRLILSSGNAGKVITAMGQYVIGGNYVMGLIVFSILIIVQFIVVSNGAQRVAEVAARFTLDSMPGKQMSIDADLNMGLIDADTAQIRRKTIEREANFYGAMDGASKFVKGDAIAGILILLVDILGGFSIGVIQKNLSLSQALHQYTLMTIGDGLITQIPALIIAVATGIIVTRAATDAELGREVTKQISRYPKSLIMVCVALLGLLFIQGMPKIPILLITAFFAIASVKIINQNKKSNSTEDEKNSEENDIYQHIKIYPICIKTDKQLADFLKINETLFFNTIDTLRKDMAKKLGFILPVVKIVIDNTLAKFHYQILIHGDLLGENALYIDKILVIAHDNSIPLPSGIKCSEPSFELPAVWTDKNNYDLPASLTHAEPLNVLITHLQTIIEQQKARLLDRQLCEKLLEKQVNSELKQELIPSLLSLSQFQFILQKLLEENVSIKQLNTIVEVLIDKVQDTKDNDLLIEYIRQKLAQSICLSLRNKDKTLKVITLDNQLEKKMNESLSQLDNKIQMVLAPTLTESFLSSLAKAVQKTLQQSNPHPVLLCSASLRRHIRQLTARIFPQLTVLSLSEIPIQCSIQSTSVVGE